MRKLVLGLLLMGAAVGLAGCAQALVVEAAPYAGDPDCARVMLAMPPVVGGLEVRGTSSQATTAYGDEYPIVVRCGVEPPGPTTEACIAVEGDGVAQDWVVSEADGWWSAVTFGRSPAVEVLIPTARAQDAVGEVLAEVSGPAGLAPENGLACQ